MNATSYPERYVGVRQGDWKCVRRVATAEREGQFDDVDGPEELYDLERDPGESENLAGERPETLATMRAALAAARASGKGAPSAAVTPAAVAPRNRERLKALGYVE
jgi:hypothetical protein